MEPIELNTNRTASCLIQEAAGYHSRDQIVIASGSGVVVSNTVLGQVTATKEYKPLKPSASDGTEIAAVILFGGVDTTGMSARGTGLVRSLDVHGKQLVWPDAITDEQVDVAVSQLATNQIITR
jgi:hypothetical protein